MYFQKFRKKKRFFLHGHEKEKMNLANTVSSLELRKEGFQGRTDNEAKVNCSQDCSLDKHSMETTHLLQLLPSFSSSYNFTKLNANIYTYLHII